MSYDVEVIEDSVTADGSRLTTMKVEGPRSVLSEFNTHRDFSRNSASSRAIPVAKQIERIMRDPFIPISFGKNQPGMQASEELEGEELAVATRKWLLARDSAVEHATNLMEMGIHKQVTNRLLEPFMWHTIIVTATEWGNFFGLRRSEMAQPEIHKMADNMWDAMAASTPKDVDYGDWHLPYVQEDERDGFTNDLVKLSAARCARVSYLTQDGVRDPEEDLKLYKRLEGPGHMSPMEHPAQATPFFDQKFGNFRGWKQLRKFLPYESDFSQRE
jgi:thymidylate synthase ThyX